MEGFTLVDAVVAVVIVLSAILAYSRGLVREVMAIVGWIGAAVVAFTFAPAAQPLIKEAPVVGTYLADSCELSMIAAFAAVFAVGLVVFALFTPLFSSLIHRTALGGVDRGAGFLFGVVRGILLIGVAFLVYGRAIAGEPIPMVENSRSAKIFASLETKLEAAVPADAPAWIVARYNDLTASCVAPTEGVIPSTQGA